MPTMYEIYDHDAAGYDALVNAEDYRGNLCRTLRRLAVWRDAYVVETGMGTGRVRRCYADLASRILGFDRSAHMLGRAAVNLSRWADRMMLREACHESLPVDRASADVYIEGWALGHAVLDAAAGATEVSRAVTERVDVLVTEARRVTRPGGTMIIIESLGTNVGTPAPPLPELALFYHLLEARYGFSREEIRTDFRFSSPAKAAELCGYFFGTRMGREIGAAGRAVVPEYTGVWWAVP